MTTSQTAGAQGERQMITGRPTIGLLCDILWNQYSCDMWAGVRDAAREFGANLVYFSGGILDNRLDYRYQANVMYDRIAREQLDGLVVWAGQLAHTVGAEGVKKFCRRFRPLPMVSIELAQEGIHSLFIDNYQGMYDLVSHLLEVHHYRRLAYIDYPTRFPVTEARYQGYADALRDHGLAVDPRLVSDGSEARPLHEKHAQPAGTDAVKVLFDMRSLRPQQDIEAIATVADMTAFEALQAMQARGIRVPDDVALVGFDDLEEIQYTRPPLTTVRQSFHEQGRKAVETLLAQIRGEAVPDRMTLPLRVVVRRSCGCADPLVARAGAPVGAPTSLSASETPTGMSALLPDGDPLAACFWTEVVGEQPGSFLGMWETRLYQTLDSGGDVAAWHDVLSQWRASLCARLEPDARLRAEALWQQARTLLGDLIQREQAHQRLQAAKQTELLRDISDAMSTTFDIDELMDVLARELPKVDIPGCYVAVYDDPSAPAGSSRLIMGYTRQERLPLPPDGQRIAPRQLFPEGMFQAEALYSLVVTPLYFRNTQIGFAMFEVAQSDGRVYELLRREISRALHGTLQVAEIARQQYVLDTFMANVPDSIYFKDRDSRFLRANPALATLFGVTDPAELVGKTDFDFFADDQARPKYDQEQQIMRTGQPVLAAEEPDARGRWSLTTKMPLRDEHGHIIGTFGISRDITALKQAQHALEQAYSEISELNGQLREENLRMTAELDVARRLQAMVLPLPEELERIQGLDIAGYMQPADEVGGDYYDVVAYGDDRVCIGIGDVTGHGLESGVLMLMAQTAIRTLIDRGESDPVTFLNTLNRVLFQNIQRMQTDKSITLAFVRYQGGQVKVIGQHEDVLVVRKSGAIERINTIDLGFPLGLERDITQWIDEVTVALDEGDGVVLYTDGITEAENADRELYGLDRLCAVISRHWQSPSNVIKQAIIDDVRGHIGGHKIYDDITLVVLKCTDALRNADQ